MLARFTRSGRPFCQSVMMTKKKERGVCVCEDTLHSCSAAKKHAPYGGRHGDHMNKCADAFLPRLISAVKTSFHLLNTHTHTHTPACRSPLKAHVSAPCRWQISLFLTIYLPVSISDTRHHSRQTQVCQAVTGSMLIISLSSLGKAQHLTMPWFLKP